LDFLNVVADLQKGKQAKIMSPLTGLTVADQAET